MVNIFVTDRNPVVAARDTCDNYVVKIPVEVAQLLSAVHWRTGYNGLVASGDPIIFDADSNVMSAVGPYKNSSNIQSTSETYRWLSMSTGNYMYAVRYGLEIIYEFKKRYGKTHKTEGVLMWLLSNVPDIPNGPPTQNVGLAMPEKYKDRDNPTLSYKRYILFEKSSIVSWKRSVTPEWAARFVYTDGAASTLHCTASYAVWFNDGDPRNVSAVVMHNPSNQVAELMAIKTALTIVKNSQHPWTVVTDSQYSIDCLTKWIHTWKQNGWVTSINKPVKHKQLIQQTADLLSNHMLFHVCSHTPVPKNVDSLQWKYWYGNMKADTYATSINKLSWHPHPNDGNYRYTIDVELQTGFPVISPSGRITGTVNDDSTNNLTNADVELAAKHGLLV